jgi:hypothetical protein
MSQKAVSNRSHLVAAAIAVIASVGLHALMLTRIDTFPLHGSRLIKPEPSRFAPIEMVEVRTEPPPKEDAVERPSLEQMASELSAAGTPEEVLTEIVPPQPSLDIAQTPALPLVPPAESEALRESMVRQEVLAIPEQMFPDEVSALPRRWIEEDIPRVEKAPDIRLPIDVSNDLTTESSFVAADAVSWREGVLVGTPDWMSVMGGRGEGVGGVALSATPRALIDSPEGVAERPEEISELEGIEDSLLVRVEGYRDPDGHLYFALQVERTAADRLPVQPRDILFVQDSSGSMTPAKLAECRRGLKRWLDFMNPGDRFEVMGFSDDVIPCFGEWRAYDQGTRAAAFQFIDGLRAVGNTDVFRSLESALAVSQDPGRTRILVLVTDGRPTVGVTGSSEIIEAITQRNKGEVSFFSVGGGKQVNSFFLDLLSYRNRGEAKVVLGDEEIIRGMEVWAGQLRRPVLTDLSYTFSRIDPRDIYPKQLTHLYLDRPLVIHGRIPVEEGPLVFQVIGRSGERQYDFVFVIEQDQITPGSQALRTRWAWQKIYHMIGDYLGDSTPERLESIRAFADVHGLIVPYGFSRAMPR